MTENAVSPMGSCAECGGTGVRSYDGRTSPCPNCPAGQEHAQTAMAGRSWESPNALPPGGDVLLKQAAADAAGVPVDALAGVPVRAMLVRDELLLEGVRHVAALLATADAGTQAARRAREWLEGLPQDYRPVLLPTASRGRQGSSAVPLDPPSGRG